MRAPGRTGSPPLVRRVAAWGGVAALLLALRPFAAMAQDAPSGASPSDPPAAKAYDDDSVDVTKPTEIGLRFTPGMARGIATHMAREMRGQYGLDDAQQEKCREIIARNLMHFAHRSQRAGRESFELFMENMIANDGAFSKGDGQRWAKLTKPVLNEFKTFMTTTVAQIGDEMTLSQRLKLTAEMAAVSAGIIAFEERLKRWEKGELADMANPFEEPKKRPSRLATSDDPNEPPDVRRARERADRHVSRETDVESRWPAYVESAIQYYELTDVQATSARSVLKEALQRAEAVKSAEWRQRIRRNRMLAYLRDRVPRPARDGPWMWHLDREYEELLAPLQEIGRELRARVDDLAETAQRERAAQSAREALSSTGIDVPPA